MYTVSSGFWDTFLGTFRKLEPPKQNPRSSHVCCCVTHTALLTMSPSSWDLLPSHIPQLRGHMMRASPAWTCAHCERVPVISSVRRCRSVNRAREPATALDLCCVCVPSEASRTLPSLESIQKVFEQQLHPSTHQRSQVRGLGGGKSRTGVWVAFYGCRDGTGV